MERGEKKMDDANKYRDTEALIENKKQQIKEILESEDITYGMAKAIIQRAEAELIEGGNTFLNKSKLKNVSPFKDY